VRNGKAFVHSALTAANIPDKWCLLPIEVNVKECDIIDLGITKGELPWAARLVFGQIIRLSFLVINKTLPNRTHIFK
jgi:hypothetical protein